MPTTHSVLVFGRDFQLVHTRSLILQRAGYTVWTASTLDEIKGLLPHPAMDVMVLCHTLSTEECDKALEVTHERWPQIQTIALVSGSSGCASEATDAIMNAIDGPAKLIREVSKHVN
jgi:DNA-binding NtrC family response regulator